MNPDRCSIAPRIALVILHAVAFSRVKFPIQRVTEWPIFGPSQLTDAHPEQ